jgi:hypothetical protein
MNTRITCLVVCLFALLSSKVVGAADYTIKAGSTDVTVYLTLYHFGDNNVSITPVTGIAYNTASLKVYYIRPGGSLTQISPVTQTVTGAHADGGWVELSSTNAPGRYRLDLPDAVCAAGVPRARVMIQATATDICVDDIDFDLVGYDPTATAIAANVKQMDDDATAAVNAESFFDGTGYGGHPGRFTVANVSSQTSFNFGGGYETDNAYRGYQVRITDLTSGEDGGVASSVRTVSASDFDAAVQTITLDSAPDFTIGAGDTVEFLTPSFAQADRGLIDTEVAAIKSKTDQLNFTVANRVDSNVTHVAAQAANPVTGNVNANVAAISENSTAADRAELFFTTGYGPIIVRSAVTSSAGQTSFVFQTGAPIDNDALNGAVCIITNDDNANQKSLRTVSDYAYSGGSATVTLDVATGFNMDAGDTVEIFAP